MLVCPDFSGFKPEDSTFRALAVPGKPGQLVTLEREGWWSGWLSSICPTRPDDDLGRVRAGAEDR